MTDEARVLSWLDGHRDALESFLSDLIRIDTQNFRTVGREAEGQKWLMEYCRKNGWPAEMYCERDIPGMADHPGYLPGRNMGSRPNVTMSFPGSEPRRRIMIAAHMDTMPVGEEAEWTLPPLGGERRDGRIWGRGASDNKGGIASGLFALEAIRACGVRLRDDVLFTSYADEEYGGGDGALAACLRYPSDVYVNLDGQDQYLSPWGIGGCMYEVTLRLQKSTETAAQSLRAAALLMPHFDAFSAKRDAEFAASPIYRDSRERAQRMRMLEVSIGRQGNDLGLAKILFVFYTLTDRAAMEAELMEMRRAMQETLKPLSFTVEDFVPLTRYFIPYLPREISEDARVFGQAFRDAAGRETPTLGACLSDLSVFGNFGGGVAFNHGLVKGFEQEGGAHQNNEHILAKDLLEDTKAIALYLLRAARDGGSR